METVRRDDGRKEEKMAFSCVLYLKEECDGCGLCEEPQKSAGFEDEEIWMAEK